MKIGIDISQIVYGTGVSNYTKYLVEALLKIDHKNKYILFGSSLRQSIKLKEFKKKLEEYKNVEFRIFRYPISLWELIFNRMRFLKAERFIGDIDLLHSSDWVEPKVKNNVKKVTTVHDMTAYLFPQTQHPKIIEIQKRKLDLVKKETDLIIADSQTTKDDLAKFLEIPQEKIKVIYLAPSAEFKPQDEDKISEVLTKYKIKKPYILSVATQEPRKNIQKLLDVFGKINEQRPDVKLVLSGKYGWGSGFHLPDNVIWTHYVPQEDLISLYCGCRVFVYPSLYEGFGLPILEAMACGAPVITSNNSSMAEIAKDAAILIDPRSEGQIKKAIEMVLDLNLDNYQKMVRASLARAKQYTWLKTAKETLEVYRSLAPSDELTTDKKPGKPEIEEEGEIADNKL